MVMTTLQIAQPFAILAVLALAWVLSGTPD